MSLFRSNTGNSAEDAMSDAFSTLVAGVLLVAMLAIGGCSALIWHFM
jgi:hypothetical protein